jgi:hypothetical protein
VDPYTVVRHEVVACPEYLYYLLLAFHRITTHLVVSGCINCR